LLNAVHKVAAVDEFHDEVQTVLTRANTSIIIVIVVVVIVIINQQQNQKQPHLSLASTSEITFSIKRLINYSIC